VQDLSSPAFVLKGDGRPMWDVGLSLGQLLEQMVSDLIFRSLHKLFHFQGGGF
jgi:hypothetical protein